MDGDKITAIDIVGEKETPNIGGTAMDQMKAKIVEKGSADVELISGATITAQGVIDAVKNAIDPTANPFTPKEEKPAKETAATSAAKAFQGFGLSVMSRNGPGKDSSDVGVYSINEVFAHVIFDDAGKILNVTIDQVEVATPNYDGEGMPHFTGFPGQSYNNDENHDEKVDGVLTATEESFAAEIASWKTKRERGESYVMGTGNWSEQMDTFQELFVGKTVEEVKEWFAKYCSSLNGRPLKSVNDKTKPEDADKYNALSDEEKAMLAEVTTGATMSLNDSHGNILAAIKACLDNKVAIDLTVGK